MFTAKHRRPLVTFTALVCAAGLASSASAVITPTLVRGGVTDQFFPAGNSTYLIWTENTLAHPRNYQAYGATPATGTPFKLNASGTEAYAGGINGETTEAVFQQVNGASSDIELYDLATKVRTPAPAAVNTTLWEWRASISPGYILFGRNAFNRDSSPWKVMLYDRVAGTTTVLDTVTYKCRCIYPDQVTDEYATWTKCSRTTCNVWYHDNTTGTIAKIPHPDTKLLYYAGVAAGSGNIYYGSSGFACGKNVKILRWNPAVGGTPVVVTAFPDGYDLSWRISVNVDPGAHEDVYFDRANCSSRNYYANIYKIEDGDTATTPASTSGGPGSGTPSLRLGPDAAP